MVFARYVMFSEVYWHHAVRSATAMLQRAFYLLHGELDLDALFRLDRGGDDRGNSSRPRGAGRRGELLGGLFGSDAAALQAAGAIQLFRASRAVRSACAAALSLAGRLRRAVRGLASAALGAVVAPHEILFDAPPDRQRRWNSISRSISPRKTGTGRWARFRRWSARWPSEQFDDYVKRVRIFVHPRLIEAMRGLSDLPGLLEDAINQLE